MDTINDNNINVNELDKDKNVQNNNNDQQLNSFELALKELDENPYLRYALDVVDKRNQYKSAESYLGSAGGFNDEGTMGLFVTNDPYGDPNMFEDRYKAFSSTYDKLGFSPYRNNEELYNVNATGWEKTKVAMKAFAHLTWIAIQQNSVILSGFNDNKRTKELATDYNYWNTIGMDSGEGFGAFARNLLVTYGSTAAVMLKMAVEEIAINVGITALTGGTGTAGTVAASSARFAKFGNFMNKVREGLKYANVIRKAYKQAGGLERFGYTFSEFIAPGAWSGIARGVHNIKKGRTLEGSLNMLHGMYSTARAYKVTQSEALLEANLSAQEYVMEMYNSGKQFTEEQVEMIKRSAEAISNEVFWKNIPAIYLSNLVIFNDLLSPVAGRFISKTFKGPNKLFGKLPQRLSHGKWYNQIYRVGKEDKRLWDYGIKSIPIALGYWIPKGGKMFAVGSVEGLQENIQDVINYSAKKYYHDMYLDNDRFHEILGSTVDVSGFGDAFKWDHLFGYSEAYQQQFTQQGWETFLTGTLMGGPTALLSASGKGLWKAGQFAVDKTKLNKLKKERDKATLDSQQYKILDKEYKAKEKAFNYKYDVDNIRSDEWLEVYDFVFNKPTDFFNKNLENMVNINATTEETKAELEWYDKQIENAPTETEKLVLISQRERAEERAKIRQWNMIFRQLCSSGEIDLVKSELEQMKNENDDVLSGLNNGNGSEDIKKRIDDCIKIIDQTQTVYDGLVKKFDNPQDMKAFLKKYGCKTELEFFMKYRRNKEVLRLYQNERMLGEAYNRAIDEMVYYANEYESAVKDKETLLDIFEKTLTKTNELLDNGLIPKSSSLTDVTSLYTEQSMQDLIDSNNVLIQSMKSQSEGTEDEKERNEINKKIEDLEYKNHQLGIIINALHEQKLDDTGNVVKDSEGKVVKLTADEFTNTIKDALQKYFKTSLNVEDDTLSNLLSEYFESYRNSKKLYDILQTITNPRNFNAIIESRNEILMDIYNQRYDIIDKSIVRSHEIQEVNDLINELYNMGYAVDNNFIAHLLGQQKSKAGKIYKITDKNFNKEDVTTSEQKITVYKYKDVDEAFKNSFDVALHPLSKEYHSIINKIIELAQKNGKGWLTEKLIELSSKYQTEEVEESELSKLNSEDTIEDIERKYLDNDKETLETLENETLDRPSKHGLADVLSKIDTTGEDTYSELISALIKYARANDLKIEFKPIQNGPTQFFGKTLYVDPRYWDKRYNSGNKESFALGLIGASLGIVLNNYFKSTEGQKNLALFENAFNVNGATEVVKSLSSYLTGIHIQGQNVVTPEVTEENKNLFVEKDRTGFLVNAIQTLFDKLNINADSNMYNAIQNTIGSIASFSSASSVKQEAQKQKQQQGKQQGSSSLSIGITNGEADIEPEDIDTPLDKLSKEKILILYANPNNENCAKYWKKHDNYSKEKKEFSNTIRQESSTEYDNLWKTIKKTGFKKIIFAKDLTNDLEDKLFILYICGKYGITQENIDNVNNRVINNTSVQPAIPTTIPVQQTQQVSSTESTITKYQSDNHITFDKDEHKYKVDDKDVDTSVTQMVDFLLGNTTESKTEIVDTIKGDIFDSAMRSYFKTGSVEGSKEEIRKILEDAKRKHFNGIDVDNVLSAMMGQLQKIGDSLKQKLLDELGWKESDVVFITTEMPVVVAADVKYKVGDKEESKQFTLGSTVDMLIQHGNDVVVVDFKTYQTRPDLAKYHLQTTMYSKIVEKILGPNKNIVKRLLAEMQSTSEINEQTFNGVNDKGEVKTSVIQQQDTELKLGNVTITNVQINLLNTPQRNDTGSKQISIEEMSKNIKSNIDVIKSVDDIRKIIKKSYGIDVTDDEIKDILDTLINENKHILKTREVLQSGEYIVNDGGKYSNVHFESQTFTIDRGKPTEQQIKNGSKKYKEFRRNLYNMTAVPYINLLAELNGESIIEPEQMDTTENISSINDILDDIGTDPEIFNEIRNPRDKKFIQQELFAQLKKDC